MNGCNLNASTIRRNVANGLIGESPIKRGPVGDFSKPVYDALKGAFSTFIKLKQAAGKEQFSNNTLVPYVSTCVKAGGFTQRNGIHLVRKLRSDTANEFAVGEANKVEQRRVLWTTYGN
jgi:hypothetical protein